MTSTVHALRHASALLPLIAPSYTSLVIRAMGKWSAMSGFPWCADRCKTVVMYAITLRSGGSTPRPSWIGRRYVRYLENIAMSENDERFLQLIQLWRMFTYFANTEISASEVDKFVEATSSPPIGDRLSGCESIGPRDTSRWPEITSDPTRLLPEAVLSGVVKVRNPMVLAAVDKDNEMSVEFSELLRGKLAVTNLLLKYCPDGTAPYALRQLTVIPDDIMLTASWNKIRHLAQPGYLGKVHLRVQSDGKHRFFYAPPIWVQWMLAPWAARLYDTLRRIPEDCTHDQDKGVRVIQQWLRDGHEVHSVDLSSATDRFPLSFTRSVLMGLSQTPNLRMWVDTFCLLSRVPCEAGNWARERNRLKPEPPWCVTAPGLTVEWKVGQPLGSIPSFAAFALSHHLLARWCTGYSLEGRDPEPLYVLLGDDIVFREEAHARAYREAMRHLGVSISEHKSVSGSIGEFAGRLITARTEGFKSRYLPATLRTLPALMSTFGPRAVRLIKQSKLRDVIALLPTPRTPSGVNPGGFPRAAVDKFLVLYYSQKEAEPVHELRVELKDIAERRIQYWCTQYAAFHHQFNPMHYPAVPNAPIGAVSTLNGDDAGPLAHRGTRTTWHWKSFQSRRWLNHIRGLAREAGLLK